MLRATIEKLGEKALLAGVDPLARNQESQDPILGFDTEYDSKTRRLVCFQLAGEKGAGLFTERLTVESLAKRCRSFTDGAEAVWLVTFWSYAELQFLPVIKHSFGWKLYGSGSFDCTFRAKDGFELRVFDLARFFERSSLARVAESFGLEKLKFDTKRVTKKSLRNPKFRQYAIHDAELCFDIMGKMREQFLPMGADPLVSKTAAGVSATAFRRQFVKDKIRCKLPNARMAGMLACWGGRAEAFKRGRFGQVFEYDLESAYPRAAVAIEQFPRNGDLEPRETLAGLLRCRGGFGKVVFSFPADTEYPCLPVVTASAQLYPLSGLSWATTYELERARELGAEIELLEGYGYSEGGRELSEMMGWALELRKGATGARKVAAKLLANALIGKLAQRRAGLDIEDLRDWCETERVDIHDAIHLTKEELRVLGLEGGARIGTCFAPEWNALITGWVRAKLNRILCDTAPVYCATDSVWTLEPIPEHRRPSDLTLKRQGAAVVVRTRLGGIWEEEGRPHLAHHSLWTRRAGERILRSFDTEPRIRYYARRAVKLRESLRRRLRLATFLRELRIGDASWDEKRRLRPDGSTAPWANVDDHLQARRAHEKAPELCRRSSRRRS